MNQFLAGGFLAETAEIDLNSRVKQARRFASGHTNWYKGAHVYPSGLWQRLKSTLLR
jgi:hypothetical protein